MLQVRVARRTDEAESIAGFELVRTNGDDLPAFTAGAHIDVHLRDGLSRQYSLCSRPDERRSWQIAVLQEPSSRGGSKTMHEQVREGDMLMVSEPKNHFPLAVNAERSLLFAGGIGITPILCMAEELALAKREFELHYCARSRSRMAFVDRVAAAPFADRVALHVDDGPPEQQFDAMQAIGSPAPGKHLYVCGPNGFMEHLLGAARSLGWAEDHLHREYFAAAPIDHSADGAFEIELKLSGRVIVVPAERTAAQALAEAGVDVPLSCEQGVCGTCVTRVLGGIPDHRDMYFTDDERERNDCFTPCCSRAQTPRLVLDL
jgi:vanillate O-demethylase ferredoxin subunit